MCVPSLYKVAVCPVGTGMYREHAVLRHFCPVFVKSEYLSAGPCDIRFHVKDGIHPNLDGCEKIPGSVLKLDLNFVTN